MSGNFTCFPSKTTEKGCINKIKLLVLLFTHRPTATCAILDVIRTPEEIITVICRFHNQIAISTLIALHNRKLSRFIFIGHKSTYFRFICTDVQPQAINLLFSI